MSLRSSIADEVRRSPVATVSGAAAAVVAGLGLVLAWIQYRSASTPYTPPAPAATAPSPNDLVLGNLLLVVSYFLAITIAAALLLRAIARKHDITALFASIPLVALTNFSTILVIYLAPPRALSKVLFASAHDLVFYASAAIIIVFCGKAVLVDLATTAARNRAESEAKSTNAGAEGWGFLLGALIILAVWGSLVFAGQVRLTRTLLPEITHPADVKAKNSDSSGQ